MALITNNGELLNVGAKPTAAEREKDRYNRMVDRQKRQFADDPVKVCRNTFINLQSNVYNINHTRLADDDLRIDSCEMKESGIFVLTSTNRTETTITDDDVRRLIGSMLLAYVGSVENNGTLYIKFKLACIVANNMED